MVVHLALPLEVKLCMHDVNCMLQLHTSTVGELAMPTAASRSRQKLAEAVEAERMQECTFQPNTGLRVPLQPGHADTEVSRVTIFRQQ